MRAAVGRWAMRRVPVGRLLWVVPLATAQQALERRELAVRVMRLEEPRRALVPEPGRPGRKSVLLGSLPWVLLLQKTAITWTVRLWANRKGRR